MRRVRGVESAEALSVVELPPDARLRCRGGPPRDAVGAAAERLDRSWAQAGRGRGGAAELAAVSADGGTATAGGRVGAALRRRRTADAGHRPRRTGGGPAASGTRTAKAAQLDVLEQHRHLAERLRDLRLLRGEARSRRPPVSTVPVVASAALERWRGIRLGARLGDVHQPLDALAQLRGHDLHALTELAGEQFRLAPRRLAHRAGVTEVRKERDRRQRHDRQKKEGDDQPKAKAHSRSQLTARGAWPRPGLASL